ncbi:MAG TPA: hypothetical protein VHZ54_13725, partial [Solirubrobacterales bacterium]|nr:hypothetical protein [Solirubrobacterales bacterium]
MSGATGEEVAGMRRIHSALRASMAFCGVVVAMLAFAGLAEADMVPNGHVSNLAATGAQFVAGSTSINCAKSSGRGVIGSQYVERAEVFDLTFEGSSGAECETTGMGGAKFKVVTTTHTSPFELVEKSTSSAKLMFTNSGASQPIEYISGSCVIKGKSDSPTGTWTNGKNGSPTATPSTLAFSKQKLFVVSEEASWKANCPAALATAL